MSFLQEMEEELDDHNSIYRCPSCRTRINSEPQECLVLRDIIALMPKDLMVDIGVDITVDEVDEDLAEFF